MFQTARHLVSLFPRRHFAVPSSPPQPVARHTSAQNLCALLKAPIQLRPQTKVSLYFGRFPPSMEWAVPLAKVTLELETEARLKATASPLSTHLLGPHPSVAANFLAGLRTKGKKLATLGVQKWVMPPQMQSHKISVQLFREWRRHKSALLIIRFFQFSRFTRCHQTKCVCFADGFMRLAAFLVFPSNAAAAEPIAPQMQISPKNAISSLPFAVIAKLPFPLGSCLFELMPRA